MPTRCHLSYSVFASACLLWRCCPAAQAARSSRRSRTRVPSGAAPQAQAPVNDVLTDSFGKLVQDTKIENKSLRLTSP